MASGSAMCCLPATCRNKAYFGHRTQAVSSVDWAVEFWASLGGLASFAPSAASILFCTHLVAYECETGSFSVASSTCAIKSTNCHCCCHVTLFPISTWTSAELMSEALSSAAGTSFASHSVSDDG